MPLEYFAVLAIGKDDLGIVAAITGALSGGGTCNVETSQMTKVGGHFATALIASSKKPLDTDALEARLKGSGAHQVYVNPIDPDDFRPLGGPEPSHLITVEANDRPGVIHEVAKVLAAHEVNITALSSHCPEDRDLLCSIGMEVALPGDLREAELERILRSSLPEEIEFMVDRLPRSVGGARA
jgi:glycine cleavage system regulatory protein